MSSLRQILSRAAHLHVAIAHDGNKLQPGTCFVGTPERNKVRGPVDFVGPVHALASEICEREEHVSGSILDQARMFSHRAHRAPAETGDAVSYQRGPPAVTETSLVGSCARHIPAGIQQRLVPLW